MQEKTRNSFWDMLMWWQVSPEVIEQEVTQYKTLSIVKSSRGLAFLLLLFSSTVTLLITPFLKFGEGKHFDYSSVSSWIGLLLYVVLGFFIWRGHRWSMIAAMLIWTFDKFYFVYLFFTTTSSFKSPYVVFLQILWWCWYMQVFYTAFRVECLRRKSNTLKVNIAGNGWGEEKDDVSCGSQLTICEKKIQFAGMIVVRGSIAWFKDNWFKTAIFIGLLLIICTVVSQAFRLMGNRGNVKIEERVVGAKDLLGNSYLEELQKRKAMFVEQCVKGVLYDYSEGNNRVIRAAKGVRDARQQNLEPRMDKYFTAKGYFEKIIDNVNEVLADIDEETVLIKSNIRKAAELRVESINLITGAEAAREVYEGIGKMDTADLYIIDALRLLRRMSEENAGGQFNSLLENDIQYYTNKNLE